MNVGALLKTDAIKVTALHDGVCVCTSVGNINICCVYNDVPVKATDRILFGPKQETQVTLSISHTI